MANEQHGNGNDTIEALRGEMFATIRALRDPEKPMELDRAKAIADVGRVIVESAKAENEFLRVTGQTNGSGFIKTLPAPTPAPGAPRMIPGRSQSGSR